MTLSEPEIGAYLATLARVGARAAPGPVIGDQGMATRARLVFVLAVTAAIGASRAPVAFAALPLVATAELAIGLVTGLTARFVMARVAIAGQLMGLSLGLGFAAQYDAHAGESAGVMRTLTTTLASLAFLTAGGLEAIVRSAAASPAELSQLAELGPALLHHATSAFGHGLALAAPIVLAAFVGNIALAVLNRAAPAVNVFSIALSAVLVLGGVILLATAAHMVGGATETARVAIDVLTG
jgi:flagellar biosynthetic protein FliR